MHTISTKCSVSLKSAPILANREVGEFCRQRNLLVKDCSQVQTLNGFSSGTFKDYRSAKLVNDFGEKNPVLYSIVYTTAGYSLGMIAREYNDINGFDEKTGIQVVSIVDEKLDNRIKDLLSRCSVVAEIPLQKKIFSREEVREIAKKSIEDECKQHIDAENYPHSYNQLAQEIMAEKPDVVFMPLGGGEAVNSFLNILIKAFDYGAAAPRLVAATIRANIFAGNTKSGSIADKLMTPHSELYPAIRENITRFGEIIIVEENEIMPAYLALRNAGINAEPSAAVAFAALRKTKIPAQTKVIVVNSGEGIYFDEKGRLRGL